MNTLTHERNPIVNTISNFKCNLCENSDCSSSSYSTATYRYFHIDETCDSTKLDNIKLLIWECESKKELIRVTTDIELPKELIWAISYNSKNILQINVDMIQFEKNFKWIMKLSSTANNCGLYCIYCVHSIIPTVVKAHRVIELMFSLRNMGYHHFMLKFPQFNVLKKSKHFFNLENQTISCDYITKSKKDKNWSCTSKFIEDFVTVVNEYAIPGNVSLDICGISKDCTGLGG